MTALLIVAVLTFVAFAIDLGFGRSDRRTARSLTDLAAVAAGYQMAGNADPNAFNPQADPEAACRAAIASVRQNTSDFDPPLSASDACSAFAAACTGVPFSPVVVSHGPWTLTISYPVTDVQIQDANLGADGLTSEDGESCERMRIHLDHERDTYFAGVIGIPQVETHGSAVVVGNIPDPVQRVVPAFLLLDRTACKAIWTNVGQGTVAADPSLLYGDGILVRSGADGQPGFMHTDSDASACGGAANDYAIYANEPSGGTDTMVVEPGVDADGNTASGVIESTATNGRSGAGGMNVPASVGQLVGRSPVDEVYQNAIESLHGIAYAEVSATAAPISTPSQPVVSYDCLGTPSTTPPVSGSWTAFINCTSFNRSLTVTATKVIFSGGLSIGNNVVILFPDASTVTVRGSLEVPQGRLSLPAVRNVYVGSRMTVGGTAAVGINAVFDTAALPGPGNPLCNAGGTGPSATNTARLVVFSPASGPTRSNPALTSSGFLTMCQTTVYLAGERDDTAYDEKSIEFGGTCSETFPCPEIVSNDIPGARFALSGEVRWFAPNQSTAPLSANMLLPPSGGIEDLAAWAEGGGSTNLTESSSVSGGGTRFTYSGIFFTPNSRLELSAGNANTGPVDAQFIARAIEVRGGRFEMRPARQNAVPVPVRGSFQLIR